MFLIFKVSYHYHCSFQKCFIHTYGIVSGGRLKKLLDSTIGAFLIVFPFLKNSYTPISDMTCFIDIYLRLKRAEHK